MKISNYIIRLTMLTIFFAIVYLIIIARLWDVQIKEGEAHRDNISRQSIRRIRFPGIRGRIFTSDKHLLADNSPSFDVVFHLAEMRRPGRRSKTIKYILDSAKRLAKLTGRELTLKKAEITRHMNVRPGLPMTIMSNLTPKELGIAMEMIPPIRGMEIVPLPVRSYPEGKTACHIIGYVGREDPTKAEDRNDYFYYMPDLIGRSSIEKRYDDVMRGSPGDSLVRVDHQGYIHETIESSKAKAGSDLILSIDWKAQEIADKLMKDKNGAFVLLDANSGAVLAMVSAPGYDLKTFVPQLSSKVWNKLQSDLNKPLLNRATNGAYTPGSIIKPLVAIAILENGGNYADSIDCDGKTNIGNARIRCWSWRQGGHGKVNLIDAIKVSCNDFFIEKGSRLGLEKLSKIYDSAGIGKRTGFALPERRGILPSKKQKMRIFRSNWNVYDTGILSIGQGIILVTPLQVATYVAAIANGGVLWKPYIVKEQTSPSGKILMEAKPEKTGHLKVSPANLRIVRNGMWQAVNAPDGSAKTAQNKYITLFGKTGTAEVGPRDKRYTNTWFVAFGKHQKKMYSLVVFVEKGQSGGRTCAPIARNFFNQWLDPKKVKEKNSNPYENN